MRAALRWRPRLRVGGLVAGSVAGLAAVVLVQQYGLAPLTRALALQGASAGVISGVLIPSGIYAGVVRVHNRRLASHLQLMAAHGAAASALALLVTFAAMSAGAFLAGTDRADASDGAGGNHAGTFRCSEEGGAVAPRREDALQRDRSETIDIQLHSWPSAFDDAVDTFRLWVPYAGVNLTVATEETDTFLRFVDGSGGGVELNKPIEDLAWMGTGLYEIHGEARSVSGETCRGSFSLRVTGSPLSTPIGQAAAAAALAGLAGAAMSARGAVRDGSDLLEELQDSIDEEAAAAAALADGAEAPGATGVAHDNGDGDAGAGETAADAAGTAGAATLAANATPSSDAPASGTAPGDLATPPMPTETPEPFADPFADPFEDPLQTPDPFGDAGAEDPFGQDPFGNDPFSGDDPFADG